MNNFSEIKSLDLLTNEELISIDGGDTVNVMYHRGESQVDIHAIGDFFIGLWAGLTH
ncbi:hypothetical protein [Solirubrum puertoriconensis]|uniref:hypothetical protein n=1 Tax=Solirubrum puertoriconensis TaxID=1751427 RepID=UPI00136676F2|nr:hypothetical protein [Solirubrum puertoriconensis]